MKKYVKPTYVLQLPKEEQERVRKRLMEAGLSGEDLEDAMNSKLVDVDYDKDPPVQEIRTAEEIDDYEEIDITDEEVADIKYIIEMFKELELDFESVCNKLNKNEDTLRYLDLLNRDEILAMRRALDYILFFPEDAEKLLDKVSR